MQRHLERAEVGEGGIDHRQGAGAIGDVRTGWEDAPVPVQHGQLQDADEHLTRLTEGDLEGLALKS